MCLTNGAIIWVSFLSCSVPNPCLRIIFMWPTSQVTPINFSASSLAFSFDKPISLALATNFFRDASTTSFKSLALLSPEPAGGFSMLIIGALPLNFLYASIATFPKVSDALSIANSPHTLRPLREFAIDKASDTFGNVAIEAYKKFKGNAPIISIENPPAGSGLSRAQDLKDVVEASRKKFVASAKEMGLSKEKAREEAEKLIGVTWDVGHINMIRKHGFGTEQLKKETQIIAPFVKHIHLSDNFGLEHTELPMGMGNVPIKEHEEILKKQFGEKFKQIKQIVETGSWFRNFNNVTPFAETLEAFGSPLYPMKMGSYWNSSRTTGGGYGSGYGTMLPSVNFSTYGAGFSQLPSELGGQAGGGRSRMAGA